MSPHVLVIDDDPDLAEALRLVLEAEGYRVAIAGSAPDAHQRIRERKPDLILLDEVTGLSAEGMEPGGDPLAQPEARDIPVVVLTAMFPPSGRGHAVDPHPAPPRPVAACLRKPIPPDRLMATVRGVLNA